MVNQFLPFLNLRTNRYFKILILCLCSSDVLYLTLLFWSGVLFSKIILHAKSFSEKLSLKVFKAPRKKLKWNISFQLFFLWFWVSRFSDIFIRFLHVLQTWTHNPQYLSTICCKINPPSTLEVSQKIQKISIFLIVFLMISFCCWKILK